MREDNQMTDVFATSGITQETVNSGIPLGTCIMLFNQWIKKLTLEKKIVFHKQSVGFKICTFVTWSGK